VKTGGPDSAFNSEALDLKTLIYRKNPNKTMRWASISFVQISAISLRGW